MTEKNKKLLIILLSAIAVILAVALIIVLAVRPGGQSSGTEDTPQPEEGIYYYDSGIQEYTLTLSRGHRFTLYVKGGTESGSYALSDTQLTLDFSAEGLETVTAALENDVVTLSYGGATMRFLKKISYTVSFDTGGGQAMEALSVLNGKTLAKPADPQREGYVFVGWYADSGWTTPFAFDAEPVTADITLYARWSEDVFSGMEYTVELDANYEGAEAMEPLQTLGGKLFALPTPSREGYQFCGWWISMLSDGQRLTCQYTEGMLLSSHTTLYALWQSEDTGSKLSAPLVNVAAGSVSWNAVPGARSYCISVINADGVAIIDNESTAATTINIPFDTYEAGLYEIRVTALANTGDADNAETVRYFNNKALDAVSVFEVIDSMLIFNTVEHAQKYLITVTCGNPEHNHTLFDNGSSRTFQFANCEMLPGGIRFTVTAVAEGYGSATSREFVYCRDLAGVEGLRYDEKTQTVIWNAVENAADYMVSVQCGNGAHSHAFCSNDGRTSLSLKECDARDGGIVVQVYPKTRGYNSPEAAQITVSKTGPATPSDIRLTGSVLSWTAVAGAEQYELLLNEEKLTATGNTFDLAEAIDWVEGAVYTVSIRAIGNGESAWSDGVQLHCRAMGQTLQYGKSVLSWQPVLGATAYEIQVNDGPILTVSDGAAAAKITLTKAGVNVLKVRFVDGSSRSDWVQTEVFAHTVIFDSRGGSQVDTRYLAVGDLTELPETEKAGYQFAAWYNVPGGPAANGMAYTDERFAGNGDLVLYAHYTPNTYTVTYHYGTGGTGEATTGTVSYERDYQLAVPTPDAATGAFGGWFSAPYGMGIQYTDPYGNSLEPWAAAEDAQVYAFWIDSALSFTLTKINGEDAYMVSAGAQIALLQEVTVPATYNGLPVAMVAGNGFKDCTSLKTINLPASLQQISLIAPFSGCSNLEAIHVYPVEGTSNGRYWSQDGVLFDNGTASVAQPKLTLLPLAKTGTYRIPDGITEIPERAFAGSALTRIMIPVSVTKIGHEAFAGSTKLTAVVFETAQDAKALTIGTRAFGNCTALEKIVLPSRLEKIDLTRYAVTDTGIVTDNTGNAFEGCTALTSVTVSAGGKSYQSVDGVLYSGDGKTLLYYPATREGAFTVPTGTIAIAPGAFIGCRKLTEITLPNTVTLVGECAFYGLEKGLTKVTFGGKGFSNVIVDRYAFRGCAGLQEVVIESGSRITELSEGAFQDCTGLKAFQIPAAMTKIGFEAFRGCTGLETLTFAANGKALAFGENVFYGCTGLTTVDLPANVSEIPGIFGGCTSLQAVNVAEDSQYLTSVDGVVFNKEQTEVLFFPQGKTGSYTLPSTVTTIANGVFANVSGLEKLTIGVAISHIGDNAFRDSSIGQITFGRGLARGELTIGDSAFRGASLGKLTLPAHTKVIGDYAFAGARYDSISLNEGIHTLGSHAFYAATGSKTIAIPNSVKTIGDYCFAALDGGWYTEGPDVSLNARGSALEVIGDYAFANNEHLDSISIPATVTELGDYAFSNCVNLGTVSFAEGSSLTTIGARAFEYCGSGYNSQLTQITIPKSVASIGAYAFYGCDNLQTVTFEEGGQADLVLGQVHVASSTDYTGATVRRIEHGHVFENCRKLLSVSFPSRLVEVGPYSFYFAAYYSDTGLHISFGENSRLTTIGEYAFYGCNLESITIPKSVRNLEPYVDASLDYSYDRPGIGAFAFAGNYSTLQEVIFEKGGTEGLTIGANAFDNADALHTIEFPARLTTYTSHTGEVLTPFANGAMVFNDAENLESIRIEAGSASYVDVDGVVYTADMRELVICPAGKHGSVEIPASVTKIHNRAFFECVNLDAITFVGGTEPMTIGDEAFKYCSKITELHLPTNVVALGSGAFAANAYKGSALETLTLSKNLQNFDGGMIVSCSSLKNIFVEAGSGYFYSDNGVLYNAEKTTLISYPAAREGEVYTVLPTTVTIGSSAFIGNKTVKQVILPAGLREIEGSAFAECTALQTVCIPNTVERIQDRAFRYCYSLSELTFEMGGSNAMVIGQEAFAGISASELMLPAAVTVLNDSAFYGAQLQKLTFESGSRLQILGDRVFQNTFLVSLVLPEGLTTVGDGIFVGCSYLKSVVFGEGLTAIGSSTFEGSSVETVSFPASLQALGVKSFAGCTSLKSVSFAPFAQLTVLPAATFANSTLEQFTVPASVIQIADAGTVGGVFANCTGLRSLTFAEGTACTRIGDRAFYGCTGLTVFSIPVNTASLGESAFEGCTGLTDITVPANTTQLGNAVFSSCTGLSEVVLNTKATALPGWMFANCSALKQLQIPASVSSIGSNCFLNSGLQTITVAEGSNAFVAADGVLFLADMTQVAVYPEKKTDEVFVVPGTVTYIASDVLSGNAYLSRLEFAEGEEALDIGAEAFYRMANLRSVAFPERLRSIGEMAFYYCPKLMFINIPASVTEEAFGNNAFIGCSKLLEIYNESALEIVAGAEDYGHVASYALNVYTPTSGESKIHTDEQGFVTFEEETENGTRIHLVAYNGTDTELTVPDYITDIYASAFPYANLTRVVIPEGVRTIGAEAFYFCKNLRELVLPSTLTAIGPKAFQSCEQLVQVAIPESVTEMGSNAFRYCYATLFLVAHDTQPEGWNQYWASDSSGFVWGYDGKEHTYTFKTNGGAALEAVTTQYAVQLPEPTRDGYVFMGWFDNAKFTGKVLSGAYYSASKHTLYAKWLTQAEYDALAGISFEHAMAVTLGTPVTVRIDEPGEYVYLFFKNTSDTAYGHIVSGAENVNAKLYYSESLTGNGTLYGIENGATFFLMEGINYFVIYLEDPDATGTFTVTVTKSN